MKTAIQTLVCLSWLCLVFLVLSQPAERPGPFPSEVSRTIYNPELAAGLDQGLRDYWQKPDLLLDTLGPLEGKTVADIGCGEGYFTLRLLERVGETGHVHATDIQPEVLEALAERIPPEVTDRVSLILANEDDTGIETRVDLILVIQVFGEVDDREGFLDQLRRIMHPESRLVLIDSKHITDPETGLTRPRNLDRLLDFLADQGLRKIEDHDFLPKQYFFELALSGAAP